MKNLIAKLIVFAQVYRWLLFSHDPQAGFARAIFKAGLIQRWSAFRRGLTFRALIFAVRDNITTNKLVRNGFLNLGSIAAPANGGAFTQANGQRIVLKKAHKFSLLVYNSKAGAIVITIKAGVYPPAEDAGLGDLQFTVTTTAFWTLCGPFDASRFLQADGSIWVDTDAGATGAMFAFEHPA